MVMAAAGSAVLLASQALRGRGVEGSGPRTWRRVRPSVVLGWGCDSCVSVRKGGRGERSVVLYSV